jgi:hypothetical protein
MIVYLPMKHVFFFFKKKIGGEDARILLFSFLGVSAIACVFA